MGTGTIAIEEVRDAAGLEALAPEWSGLCERSPLATPFQSPEWALPWWELMGGGGLFTLALRIGRGLAGVAPLFIYKNANGEGRRVLTFLGSGISDYLGFAVLPEYGERAIELFLGHIASKKGLWDVCTFDDVPAASPLACAGPVEGMKCEKTEQDACPVLKLPRTFEEFLSKLPGGYRARVKRSKRAFEKIGGLKIEIADTGNLDGFLDDFFWLHTARWASEGGVGLLFEPNVREFHREAARGFLKKGWLRLYRMEFGDRAVASVYSFAKDRRFYAYLGGFLPQLSRMSPGRVLMAEVIKDAINAGFEEFDFLRGREDYKYTWGAKDSINVRIVCHGE